MIPFDWVIVNSIIIATLILSALGLIFWVVVFLFGLLLAFLRG